MRKLCIALTLCLLLLLGASACAEGCTNHVLEYYDSNDIMTHSYGCKTCGLVLGTTQHVVSCMNANHCVLCGRNDNIEESVQQNIAHDVKNWTVNATQHTGTCADCGETVTEEHFAYCDATGTCAVCGETGVTISEVRHEIQGYKQHNPMQHAYGCIRCSYVQRYDDHSTFCGDLSDCAICGDTDIDATYRENPSLHSVDMAKYEYGEYEHCNVCSICFERCFAQPHTGTCEGGCTVCGAKGVYIEGAEHSFSGYTYTEIDHTRTCSVCGFRDSAMHYATCQNETVCYVCGAENVQMMTAGHEIDYSQYAHDAYAHYYTCKYCDEQFDASSHYGPCWEGACRACGRAFSECENVSMEHDWSNPWVIKYTDEGHGNHCSSCDALMYMDAHPVSCQDQTTCKTADCGRTGLPADVVTIEHTEDARGYRIGDTQHWRVCADCGEQFGRDDHFYSCTQPAGVCQVCGGATTNEVHWNLNELFFDETQHWWGCGNCGKKVQYELHQRKCNEEDNGTCNYCGASDVVIGNITHDTNGELGWNETECWVYCMHCREPQHVYPHVPSEEKPGYCATCDYHFASMNLSAETVYAEPGQAFMVDVTVKPAGEYTITYTSDAPQTASVAADGTITAVAAGTARITVTVKELHLTKQLVVYVGDLHAASFHAGVTSIEANAMLNTAVELLDLSALTNASFGVNAFARCAELCQLRLPANGGMPVASDFAGADKLVVFCADDEQMDYAADAGLPYVIAK